MESTEFSKARQVLGKTQTQLSQILCISPKTVQSFEQGWRRVPNYIEREILLLLSLKIHSSQELRSCWNVKNCPPEWRAKCFVWELKAGHLCWFINGTFCRGQVQNCWEEKLSLCRSCEVYRFMFKDTGSKERS